MSARHAVLRQWQHPRAGAATRSAAPQPGWRGQHLRQSQPASTADRAPGAGTRQPVVRTAGADAGAGRGAAGHQQVQPLQDSPSLARQPPPRLHRAGIARQPRAGAARRAVQWLGRRGCRRHAGPDQHAESRGRHSLPAFQPPAALSGKNLLAPVDPAQGPHCGERPCQPPLQLPYQPPAGLLRRRGARLCDRAGHPRRADRRQQRRRPADFAAGRRQPGADQSAAGPERHRRA